MADAVDLDGKACRGAVEVENVRSNRMLSAENRVTWNALAQSVPQPDLGHRERTAQVARTVDRDLRRSHGRSTSEPPPPSCCAGRSLYPFSRGSCGGTTQVARSEA